MITVLYRVCVTCFINEIKCHECFFFHRLKLEKHYAYYPVWPMPRSSLCKGSDGIRSPESQDEFSVWVVLCPLDDLVQAILPVSIVVSTGSLVEIEVDQVVICQCSLFDEVIHCIKTFHLYVFKITLGCHP